MTYQIQDSKGYVVSGVGHASQGVYIEGNATTAIFATKGVLLRIIITKDIDGGSFTVQDADATEVFSGITDYAGSFSIGEYFENGVTIVTTNFDGGQMRIVAMPLL